jgi:hypothetical protein
MNFIDYGLIRELFVNVALAINSIVALIYLFFWQIILTYPPCVCVCILSCIGDGIGKKKCISKGIVFCSFHFWLQNWGYFEYDILQ